jgi:hypothetical protein
MEHILKNHGDNNVISVSTRINSMHNIICRVIYHDCEELHKLLENVKAIPYVVTSEWSELVKVVENDRLRLRI